MSYKDFEQFYDKLISECEIPSAFKTKKWFNQCKDSQKEILKFFGGKDTFLEKVPRMDTKGVPPSNVIMPRINKVIELMPTYLSQYSINKEDLIKRIMSRPMRIATTKHIMGYAKRSDLCPMKTAELSKTVSEMGSIWHECQNSYKEQDIVISFNPKAFIHIGCSGVNPSSCWRQNATNKFGFGITPNVFCWYMTSDINDDPLKTPYPNQQKKFWTRGNKPPTDHYINRGLGWIDFENKEVFIFNTYGANTEESYLTCVWSEIYKKWFNINKEKNIRSQKHTGSLSLHTNDDPLSFTYINSQAIVFSSDKKVKSANTLERFKNQIRPMNKLKELS